MNDSKAALMIPVATVRYVVDRCNATRQQVVKIVTDFTEREREGTAVPHGSTSDQLTMRETVSLGRVRADTGEP